MADTKITALTALTAADPANDVIPIVDVSDTSMAASGTTKKISVNNILGASGTATLASATITGAATVGTTLGVTGNATLSSNLVVRTNKLKVDGNGVGVGCDPTAILDVASSGTASTYKVTAIIKDETYPASGYPTLEFRGFIAGNDYRAGVGSIGGQQLAFYIPTTYGVAPTLAMTLNSTANLVLKGGTAAADGVGVTFPAVQVASSDANCLDDYEEGTWTPVVADATTGGNVGTCTINHARYTKIGRQVSVECNISSITSTGMTGGNPFYVRNLPFASVTGGNGNFYSLRVGRNASTVSSSVFCLDGTSYVYFPLYTTNSATTGTFILVSDIVSGTSEIILSVTYYV